uniref:Uncharacterized protein n=1 Tax=Nelumbo nucifera TaxID=4432 RepID=A0A822YB90_NELNU|nr:TPA_asm: hypothetical protein HUJ06_030851 [Nelumbo nucifera]
MESPPKLKRIPSSKNRRRRKHDIIL